MSTEGTFEWTDGSAGERILRQRKITVYRQLVLDTSDAKCSPCSFSVDYSNWHPGLPNSAYGDGQDCVRQLVDGSWDHQECSLPLNPYICETGTHNSDRLVVYMLQTLLWP